MSVGCVLAFIRTWTSVSVNVGWNSWANNMAGYGLKDWSLSLFCARLAVGLTCSFIYWTLDCEAGHLPVVWKWSFTASLQYIFEACCLITGAIFSLHLHYVCVCVCILLALKLKFEAVSDFLFFCGSAKNRWWCFRSYYILTLHFMKRAHQLKVIHWLKL
jgi:hypothetical protein